MVHWARKDEFDLLRDFSLEMTVKDLPAVRDACDLIPAGTPISVTFLNGEDTEDRLNAAREISSLGFTAVPHISARRLTSRDELRFFLDRLRREAAVRRVFVIAGDAAQPAGPFADALTLLASGELEDQGIELVGIAGYPEGHPQIGEPALWSALRAKRDYLSIRGYQVEIVTQFGFDTAPIIRWLERLRAEQIDSPVRIGIAGPANAKTLMRFAARCGVGASRKILAKYGLSLTKLLSTTGPDRFVSELQAQLDPEVHGVVKLHFYPFGGFAKTASWVHDFAGTAARPVRETTPGQLRTGTAPHA